MSRPVKPSLVLLGTILMAAPAAAQLAFGAFEDATLYEAPRGAVLGCTSNESNGGGQHLFSGVTDVEVSNTQRRALLRFDTSAIPAGSVVQSVSLTLNLNRSAPEGPVSEDFGLHRVLASWGEGTTDAGGPEGDGAQASPGDATWCERFYTTTGWTTPGGDFVPVASAVIPVGSVAGQVPPPSPHTWGSTAAMVADVQSWVDDPASNFGWILVDEGTGSGAPKIDGGVLPTARRFDSSESPAQAFRPQLIVTFGAPIPTTSWWGLGLLAGLLAAAGLWALGRLR